MEGFEIRVTLKEMFWPRGTNVKMEFIRMAEKDGMRERLTKDDDV